MSTEVFPEIYINALSVLCAILLFIVVCIINSVICALCGCIIKTNEQKEVIFDFLLFAGAMYVSYVLLKDEEFIIKNIFPAFCFLVFVFSVWSALHPDKTRESRNLIFKEEKNWMDEALGRKQKT